MRTAIALPRNRQGVEDLLDLSHILIGERCGFAVLDDAVDFGGAGDGDGALATYPADGYLRCSYAFALGDVLHRLDKLEVLVKGVGLEARLHAAEVVLREVVKLAYLARQPSAADRAVCHDGNANCMWTPLLAAGCWLSAFSRLRTLMAGVHYTIVQRVGREQAQLDLDSRDGLYGMSLANRFCADLA